MDPIQAPQSANSKDRLQLVHGWSIELDCPTCQNKDRPIVTGSTPNYELHFGETPTIYANLTCSRCGTNLKQEAGKKLVELFSPVSIPEENKQVIVLFTLILVGLPLTLLMVLGLGIRLDWWGYQGLQTLALLPLILMPTIFWFNRRVAALGKKCPCSFPDYEFMGMLGRSYCHRCRSCGKLLRLRD